MGRASDRLRILEPLGYLQFISLVRGARFVVTDSDGIQEETTVQRRRDYGIRRRHQTPLFRRRSVPSYQAGSSSLICASIG